MITQQLLGYAVIIPMIEPHDAQNGIDSETILTGQADVY